ncbi:MAG: PIN domain nuclease [bacterium]
MILVDTTVWIDLFAGKKETHITQLTDAINNKEDICICGLIITEVLQGIKNDKDFKKTQEILNDLIYLPASQNTYIQAAQIYRLCRKKGITIRKPIDCIIASICIENTVYILHNDRDFDHIAKHFPLQKYSAKN